MVLVVDGFEQLLSQEDFFVLLIEQLVNQDLIKLVDNDQMVLQMIQFIMVDGISKFNEKFEMFVMLMILNQVLQVFGLIGQNVLVESNIGYMVSEGVGLSGFVVND